MGPQAAAEHVLQVDAVPDDGGAPPGGPPRFDAYAEWHKAVRFGSGIATDILAAKLPFWKLSEEEKQALGDAWAPMLAEWFPDAMPQWLVAAGTTLMIFGPRVMLTSEAVKEEERRQKAGGDAPSGPKPSAAPSNDAPREKGTAYPDRAEPQR
jgi:hypothetical protein